ncbi:MAG: chromosome segregation protein SMC [Acidimicrobiales bacterium]
MFLKSLTLKGFKSFAEPTVLEMEPGVTVVVGPNGSGKSNIADALSWVLGAQSPRLLRSGRMDDVIYAGSAGQAGVPGRPALGRAEVVLTIDNASGALPIGFTEVSIARTLFRNGDSEYAMNGVPCRLLDVQELLSDSGVGRQQHVIVSQGQLDAVLGGRPEERRAVIEEAAGVLKYRRRKDRAERRLESTDADLVRLGDLASEARRQLRPLERQARAAGRHGEVKAEADAIRLYVSGRELVALEAELAGSSGAVARAREGRAALSARLSDLDGAVAAAEEAMSSASRSRPRDGLELAGRLSERARGLASLCSERRRSLERDLGRAAGESLVASLESSVVSLAAEIAATDAEALALSPELDRIGEQEEALVAESRRVSEAASGAARPGQLLAAMLGEARAELAELGLSSARAGAELDALLARVDAAAARRAELGEELAGLLASQAQAEAEAAGLRAEVALQEDRRDAAREAAAAAESEARAADAAAQALAVRAETLGEALDQARARAGSERLSGVVPVLGTLVDVVEVDEGYEAGFAAAAGDAMAAVVLGSSDAALALAHLKASGGGGAVIPTGRPPPPPAPPPPGGVPLLDHVRATVPEARSIVEWLVRDVLVAGGGIEAAVALAEANPGRTVVTTDGDRLGREAWRIDAAGTTVTLAAVAEARTEAASAAAVSERASAVLGDLRRTLSHLDALPVATHARLQHLGRLLASSNEAVGRATSEMSRLADEEAVASERAGALRPVLERDRERAGFLQHELQRLEAESREAAERQRETEAELSGIERRRAAVAVLRHNLEMKAASIEERRSVLGRKLAEAEERLAGQREARAHAAERRERLETQLAATRALGRMIEDRLSVLDDQVGLARRARARAEAGMQRVSEELEAARKSRSECAGELRDVEDRIQHLEVTRAECRVQAQATRDLLARDLQVAAEVAVQAPRPELAGGVTPEQRLAELEAELARLGPVNPLAAEQYREASEHVEFVEAQLEDVKESRREVRKVISAIDEEIETVFASAYSDVAAHFGELFERLFPGGRGELLLTDPEDLLGSGVEVRARPAGKAVSRLSLLSGGERALTALGFLFAVFRARPSPFYLLDEVEAALDDVSLQRFLDLVQEFGGHSQVLIVTHQRRTMEVADCLYGVAMAPEGVSRVVSERAARPGR